MRLRDFALLVAICLTWGFSNVLSKIVVGEWHIPPLFFAAARFAIVFAVTIPWLVPVPRPVWRIVLVLAGQEGVAAGDTTQLGGGDDL